MKYRIAWICAAAALTLNLIIGYKVQGDEARKNGGGDDVLRQLDRIMKVIQLVRKNYADIDKVTTDDLLEGALQGISRKLDPYSTYLPPDDFMEIKEDSDGEFGGVGVVVVFKDGTLEISSVMPNSPGQKAGILPGDIVTSINGKPLTEKDVDNAVRSIKGKPGTTVKIGIRRPSGGEDMELELTRAMIQMPNVLNAHVLEGTDIAYARITQFRESTARNLEAKLKEFQEAGVSALILDLRNNPGGLLLSAVDVCSKFLPESKLVVTVKRRSDTKPNRESENFQELFSKPGYKFPENIRLLILTNSLTASASEITAGCLRDHNRAVLLGTKTYGKGSVQNVVELGDGSAFKLTVARYYTPDPERPTIDKNGVKPDISETLTKEENTLVFNALEEGKLDMKADKQLLRALEVLKSMAVLDKTKR